MLLLTFMLEKLVTVPHFLPLAICILYCKSPGLCQSNITINAAVMNICCYQLLMLCVITEPSIKAIDNTTLRQYSFIKGKQGNNQYKVRSFSSW